MHACYSRHRALAFGGRKSGSGIKVGKAADDDPLRVIIDNAEYVGEEERTSKNVIAQIIKLGKKIKISDADEIDADDVDAFDQFAVGILS